MVRSGSNIANIELPEPYDNEQAAIAIIPIMLQGLLRWRGWAGGGGGIFEKKRNGSMIMNLRSMKTVFGMIKKPEIVQETPL